MRLKGIYTFPFQLYLGLMGSLGVVITMASIPALPAIAKRFQCPPSLSGWTVTAAMMGAVVCQFFWGPFSDKYGRTRSLWIASLLAAISSFVCYLATDIQSVLLGRFFQGFSSGAGLIVVRAICRDLYVGNYLNRMIAWVLTVIPFAAGVAPSLGDILVQHYSWNTPFLFLTICSLLLAVATPFFMKGYTQPASQSSLWKVLASCRSFWRDPVTLRLFMICTLAYSCFFIFIPSSPFIFQEWFGIRGYALSMSLFAFPFGTFCGGFFQSWQGWRYTPHRVVKICWGLVLTSLALNLFTMFFTLRAVFYIGFMMLFGGGVAIINAICIARAMQRHPPHCSGNLSSFLGIGQTLGSAFGSFIFAYLLAPQAIISVIFVIALLCFWAFLHVPQEHDEEASPSEPPPDSGASTQALQCHKGAAASLGAESITP